MKKGLFKILEKYQRKRPKFVQLEEYQFFINNRSYLSKVERFTFLDNVNQDEFDVMRANIIINAYLNKVSFEEEMSNIQSYIKKGDNFDHVKIIQTLKEKMIDKPYFLDNKEKIYIPFFSRTLNTLYNREPEKLLNPPYSHLKDLFADSVIDPFDTYGADLFNSNFTRLIKIKEKDKITAYFHYDTNTIYFINDEGRLDNKLVLFDKYLKHPSYNHMLDRIAPIVEAYFSFDREAVIHYLEEEKLISHKLVNIIHRKAHR